MSDYFTVPSVPAFHTKPNSQEIRTVFAAIGTAFDKLPALIGNGDKFVVVNSAGTALSAVAAGAVIPMCVFALNVTAPNAGIPALTLVATDAGYAGIDVSISPKGTTSAFYLGPVADNGATGGNKRGAGAIDLQLNHAANTQVASGGNSGAFGRQNTASGQNSYAVGQRNVTSGAGAVAVGSDNTVSGAGFAFGSTNTVDRTNAAAIGANASALGISQIAMAQYGHSVSGDAQRGLVLLTGRTTDAAPLVLTADAGAASTANTLRLQNSQAIAFHGTVMARRKSADGTASAAWKVEGLIRREANAASTVLVASTVTAISNIPAWTLALTADAALGGLAVTFTGAAATNIQVLATLDCSEVLYA